MYCYKHYLSGMNAFGRPKKAGIQQSYQPLRFEGLVRIDSLKRSIGLYHIYQRTLIIMNNNKYYS
jgi:hypothetical protein